MSEADYLHKLKEKIMLLLDFVRIDLCISAMFFGLIGYLLFSSPSKITFWIALTSFFACAGAYSYNSITDQKEDVINRKKVNPFASAAVGKITVISAFLLGFISSLFLSRLSAAFYIITIITSLIYSKFRLKRYLLVKNLYTGFGVMQVFLIGAAASSAEGGMISYYILFSVFVLIGSIISDLRDYEGDKALKIRTVPVDFGYDFTKKVVLLSLSAYLLIMAFLQLLVMIPFILLMSLSLYANRPSSAHFFGGLSFIFLTGWLLL